MSNVKALKIQKGDSYQSIEKTPTPKGGILDFDEALGAFLYKNIN